MKSAPSISTASTRTPTCNIYPRRQEPHLPEAPAVQAEVKDIKKQILKRLLHLAVIIIGLSFLTYLLMYISPGDPALKKLNAQGISVSEETLEAAREEMGLNEPFLVRYAQWLGDALTGDLGTSYKDGLPVADKLVHALRYTLILSAGSLAVSLIVALPLSVISAVKKDRQRRRPPLERFLFRPFS